MIYLDNASTSWPKPKSVVDAMSGFLTDIGASPARGNCSAALEALGLVLDCREEIASFFGSSNPFNVVFSHNVTWALNTVIHGMLGPSDKVVSTSMEHNAVTRPLNTIAGNGTEVVYSPCDQYGLLCLESFSKNCKGAKLAIINHGSNVTGTVQDIAEISKICKSNGTILLIDVAQSAGIIPIDVSTGADIIAFTGHKGLLGPAGTGGLVFADSFDAGQIKSFAQGGTGSLSEQTIQPDFLPDKFEAGTMNGPGLAGLLAGIKYLNNIGLKNIYQKKRRIAGMLAEAIEEIDNSVVYRPPKEKPWTAVISFTLKDMCTASIADFLSMEHGICCRYGFHCAASAHKTIGTFPGGTVRLSPGIFTTEEDVQTTIEAIKAYRE